MTTPNDELANAFARHQKGDLAAAHSLYRKVIKAQPGNADAHYLLGMLCLERNAAGDAAKHLTRAIRLAETAGRRPDHGWRLACGAALQRLAKHEEALAEFNTVLREAPGNVDALFCRGTVLHDFGRLDAAIESYESVLRMVPRHAEAANNLGTVYRSIGQPGWAIRAFRQAVAAKPDYAQALGNLGRALSDHGTPSEALPFLRRACRLLPDDRELKLVLYDALVREAQIDEVERDVAEYLRRHPDDPDFLTVMAFVRQYQGRKDDAVGLFRKALDIDAGCIRAQIGIADINGEAGADRYIDRLTADLRKGGHSVEQKSRLQFALGRHLAAAGRHEESFRAHREANALCVATLRERGGVYDRARAERYVHEICDAYPKSVFEGPGISESRRPVFIIGMPRSGTTLTEQILASHPRIYGAGELSLMAQIAAELGRGQKASHALPSTDALGKAARFYLEATNGLNSEADRVVDKMPTNFVRAGLIALLFPKARIIHCRRDPIDTCLSCFMQNASTAAMAWSRDLNDLGHYYCQYRRLMDHWRAVLPARRMLEIDYEVTVTDLEGQARRLVDFVGLDWDDACLRFHDSDRTVATPSHAQVRRKIYTGSVGRWKRYGDGVLPLLESLAACGCGVDDEGEGPQP